MSIAGTDATLQTVLKNAIDTEVSRYNTGFTWADGTAGTTTMQLTGFSSSNILLIQEAKNHPFKIANPAIVLQENILPPIGYATTYKTQYIYSLGVNIIANCYDVKASYDTLVGYAHKVINIITNYIQNPANSLRVATDNNVAILEAFILPASEAELISRLGEAIWQRTFPLGVIELSFVYSQFI